MNYPDIPYRIFPLGDAALIADFGNVINEDINRKVLALFHHLRRNPLPGMIETVPAYSSLTIYYDIYTIYKSFSNSMPAYDFMAGQLTEAMKKVIPGNDFTAATHTLPVCYDPEYAPDASSIASQYKIPVEEIMRLHTSHVYRVFMLGFLPGFPYMGEVDEKIAIPRKSQPVNVAAGSIGIAGRQTGIYSLASPGGWHIIGRTPVKLFDTEKEEPALLKAGDNVRFIPISKNEFENY